MRNHEGANLRLRLWPHAPAFPETINQTAIADSQDAEPMRAKALFGHEMFNFGEELFVHA